MTTKITVAMVAELEIEYIQRYARERYTGCGEIVDLGCWMGATSMAIARGLEENPRPKVLGKKVQAFDRFVWESWMDQFVADTPLAGRYQPGELFLDSFRLSTDSLHHRIDLHAGDLLHPDWSEKSIEFLFIDAMKSWELTHSISRTFFPCLLAGKSLVMHQDFCHFGTYWIHLLMHRLKRYFEPVCDLKNTWSVVFLCRENIPPSILAAPLKLSSFSPDEIDAAFAFSSEMVSPDKQAQLVGAHAMALLHKGLHKKARQLLSRAIANGISPADRQVPLGLLFGHTLLEYYAAKSPEAGQPVQAQHPATSSEPNDVTGERHIQGGEGQACADLIHMLRYAYAAPHVRGRTVLDIACGSGYGSEFLATHGALTVVGVDISPEAIAYARSHHTAINVRYVEGDAHSLSELPDASFDIIISFETIEHLHSPVKFLTELRRVLKPDGTLLLSCPNDEATPAWQSSFHLRTFSFAEYRDMVLQIFDQARFIGQYHFLGSFIADHVGKSLHVSPLEELQSPLLPGQNLIDLPSIEKANGYLAVVGCTETGQTMNCSHEAFRELLGGFAFLQDETARAKNTSQEECRKRLRLEAALAAKQAELETKCTELAIQKNALVAKGVELEKIRAELTEERATILSRLNRLIAKILGRR